MIRVIGVSGRDLRSKKGVSCRLENTYIRSLFCVISHVFLIPAYDSSRTLVVYYFFN